MLETRKLQSEGVDIIDLGPGEPDFSAPRSACEAGIDAIRRGLTRYSAVAGLQELREAVAERYNLRYCTGLDSSNVIITSGAKQAVFNTCFTLFESGDEVLIPVPYWVTLPEAVKLAGATPRFIQTRPESKFIPSISDIEKSLRPSVNGLIVNTPNNPTGAVLPGDRVQQLVELSRKHGLYLLFDETYDFYTYGKIKHESLISYVSEGDLNFAIAGSFSKTYAMTGWRLGYCIAPSQLIQKLNALQSHSAGNACTISQRAAIGLIEAEKRQRDNSHSELLQVFDKRRQLVLKALSEIPGLSCSPPDGAFYVFPNVEGVIQRHGLSDSTELSRFLLHEAGVSTVPGNAFGLEGFLRLSYTVSTKRLEEGLHRIQKALL
jgi:aspartate aminotransferase